MHTHTHTLKQTDGQKDRVYLKTLRANFLPFLHPGDAGSGLPQRLAHEGGHAPGYSYLVIGGSEEAGSAYDSRETHRPGTGYRERPREDLGTEHRGQVNKLTSETIVHGLFI